MKTNTKNWRDQNKLIAISNPGDDEHFKRQFTLQEDLEDSTWWTDRGNVAAFVEYLVDVELFTGVQVRRVLEEPHKWCEEFREFRREAK